MKNRILFTVLVLSMLLLITAAPVSAATEIKVILDGTSVAFAPTPEPVTPEPEPTTPPELKPASVEIDQRLLGQWGVTTGSTPIRYTYQFNVDGTFFMVRSVGTSTTASFYTSNGVVYLKNVITTYREDATPLVDKESEYSFGTDQYGEYVLIAVFSTSENIPDSNPVYKFRK